MNIINLTPHDVTVRAAFGNVTFRPSGQVARVATVSTPTTFSPGHEIRCYSQRAGEITGLPAASPDTVYIVSAMVRIASGRRDLLSPGELIRDGNGQPVACDGLIGNWGCP